MHRTIRTMLAAATTACGLASTAFAQCDIYRLDIPDFDQRRETSVTTFGLPGNGGTFCVPTSAMNWLAYVTNHGYPEVLGGVRNWESNANYNFVTLQLTSLGLMMNTASGTDYANGLEGLTQFFENTSPDNFVVTTTVASGGNAPSPEDIFDCMAAGLLVNLCTSSYQIEPAGVVAQPGGAVLMPQRLVNQGGGHCVTMARVTDACSDSPRVWFRDPSGHGGDNFSQSQFVTQYLPAIPTTTWYAGSTTSTPVHRTMYWLYQSDNPSKHSMLQGIYVIAPVGSLTAEQHLGTISVMNLHASSDFAPLPNANYDTPGNAEIIGMRYLPHLGAAAVLTRSGENQGKLYRFSPGTGEFKELATIDSPGDLAVGRRGEVYVASRGASSGGINVCMADGSVRFISTGTQLPIALAYDDSSDRVGMLLRDSQGSHAFGTIGAIGTNPATFGQDIDVEPVITGPLVGHVKIAFNGFRGGVFVAAGDINGIAELVRDPNGALRISTSSKIVVSDPDNLQIDSRGRLFCTSGGVARQFAQDPNGQWRENPNYKFAGRRVGDIFEVMIGRAGRIDPDQPRPNDNPNSFPDAAVACAADFNASGDVSVQDLFDFLAKFFANSPEADFNASGALSVQDLFDFLAAYFRGCE